MDNDVRPKGKRGANGANGARLLSMKTLASMATRQFVEPPDADPRSLKPLSEHLAFIRKLATTRMKAATAEPGLQTSKKRKRPLSAEERQRLQARAKSMSDGYADLMDWYKCTDRTQGGRFVDMSAKIDLLDFIVAAKAAYPWKNCRE